MTVLCLLLSGCSVWHWFDRERPDLVTELHQFPSCGGQGPDAQVHLFDSVTGVTSWEQQRGVEQTEIDAAIEGPFVVVEAGDKGVDGYGVLVSRDAVVQHGARLVLQSTFYQGSQPNEPHGSGCVLLALPPQHYSEIDLYDQEGALRASTSTTEEEKK